MSESLHRAVYDWLSENQDIKALFFNFGELSDGNTTISTSAGEKTVQAYLGGAEVRQYDFFIIQYKAVDAQTPNNPFNAEMIIDVERVMGWVRERNKRREFPRFPANCRILSVETPGNMPTVAGQDQTGAKYMFAVRITYIHEGKLWD